MKRITEHVTVHQAKTHLSRLLVRVSRGETIIIDRGSTPIAQLTAVPRSNKQRVLGIDEGKVEILNDFDSLPNDISKYFK